MGGGGGGGRGLTPSELQQLEQKAKESLKTSGDASKCNVFISFAAEDLTDVNMLRAQAKNENSDFDLNIALFEKTIEQWKIYRKTKAELDASVVEGGSMYPTIYASRLATTTKEKIESLKNEYAIDLRRYASR